MHAKVKAELVHLAAPFCATGNRAVERPFLGGVALQPCPAGGAFVVASDGHRIAVFHDAGGEVPEPVVVSVSKTLERACKPANRDVGDRRLVLSNGAGSATAGVYLETFGEDPASAPQLASESVTLPDDFFPDWLRLFPGTITETPVTPFVNPGYLADFCRVAGSWDDAGYPWIRLLPGDEDRLAIVVWTVRPDFIGLLMPIDFKAGKPARVVSAALPWWLTASVETGEAEPDEASTETGG